MSSRSDTAAINALLKPRRLWSYDDLLHDPNSPPKKPGVYAWYFLTPPPRVPVAACVRWHGRHLLYVGIAADDLRGRIIGQHFQGRSRSTLRLSLGVLLERKLRLVLRRDGKSFDYGDTEERITTWMSTNAFVTWAEHPVPDQIEREAIRRAGAPLNLDLNTRHPFHAYLTALRKSARGRAHASPAPE